MLSTVKNPTFLKIYLLPLFAMVIGSITDSVVILYILELGGGVLEVNLITTVRSAMGILLLVPFGILSDRLGRRPMLLYPRVIMFLGALIYAVATNPNHLLIASVIGGFAGGSFYPVLLSIVGDVSQPEQRQEVISIFFVFSSIGLLIGPIISSLLLTSPHISLRNIYQLVTVAHVCFILYLVTQIRETKSQKVESGQVEYRSIVASLFGHKLFQTVIVMSFLYFFYNSIMLTYLPMHARINLDLSNAEVASVYTFRNLAIMVIRFSSATILLRVSVKPFLVSSLVLGALTGFISPFANTYLTIVLVLFFAGLSYGAVMTLGSTLIASSSTTKNRGIANSLYMGTTGISNFTNILTTPIAETVGFSPIFLIGGSTAILAVIFTWIRKLDV